MSTTVTYKGSTLTTAVNQTRKLKTSGKYMEDDVTIVDVTSAQNPQAKSVTISSAGTREVTPDVGYDALSKVTITTPSVIWGTPTNTITKEDGYYKYGRTYPNFSDGYLDETEGVFFDLDLETKSVTPTESAQTVTPTDNLSYLDSVTVSAIPSNYVGTGVARCDEDDVLFNSSGFVGVTNGYYPSNTTKQIPSASIYGGLDVACFPSITVNDSGVVDVEVFANPSTVFCYNSGWVNTSDTVTVVIRGSSTYQLTVGDSLEYGITDGTLPLVGVAKAGYAEI